MSDETLKHNPDTEAILQAIGELSVKIDRVEKRLDDLEKRLDSHDVQLEAIREGIVHNSAGFDRLEAIALDAKSIALTARSQLTILTPGIRQSQKILSLK